MSGTGNRKHPRLRCYWAISLFVLNLIAPYHGAWAWGELGHRVVGELAERNLCAKARQGAAKILIGESLAEASTWADDIKGKDEYKHFAPWHYVSIPRGGSYASSPKSPDGDAVRAIDAQLALLMQPSSKDEVRRQALRLLVHFVGDLHQPLHAGPADDRGGNQTEVLWFGMRTNLHSVWDGAILQKLGLSYSELVRFLDRTHSDFPPFEMRDTETWADESAKLSEDAYEFEGARSQHPAELPRLGYPYYDRHVKVTKIRLWQAAHRLAGLLNQAFNCPTEWTEPTRDF